MASINLVKEKGKRLRLVNKINKFVKEADELPDELIMTYQQLEYIYPHKQLEILPGNAENTIEALFYTDWNVMEIRLAEE